MSAKNGKPTYVPRKTSNATTYVLGALALIVVAALVIGGVLWQNKRTETRNDGYGSVKNSAVQVEAQDKGAVRVGLPTAPKTIDIFEDPMCPYCGELERSHGQEIAQAVDEGKLAVRYHIVDFLNRLSASGDYSTRAVAASECVAEAGDAIAYSKFHTAIFSEDGQPEENGSSDHTNDELASIAKDAGADDGATQCISTGAQVSSAAANAQAANEELKTLGGEGTPSVFDGTNAIDTRNSDWVAELL